MGNTLTTDRNNRVINESLLGKEISKILINRSESIQKGGIPVNLRRACCMGIVKKKPSNSDFITVKIPSARDNKDTKCKNKGNCMEASLLGLQVKGDQEALCKVKKTKYYNGRESCDNFMKNLCARALYERGCIVIKKNKGKNVRVWNAKNKNCFRDDGSLAYGYEECRCINSQTGFSLNTNPGTGFPGGPAFKKDQNPYGINKTDSNNVSTKYSLNIFGYESQYQKPHIFDSRCNKSATSASSQKGSSKSYLLPAYKDNKVSICLNQINIKDSDIGEANMSNIKQNNNCGSGGKPPVKGNKDPEDTKVDEKKKVGKDTIDKVEENEEKNKEIEKEEKKKELKKSLDKAKKEKEQKEQEKKEKLKDEIEDKKTEKELEKTKKEAEKAKKAAEKAKKDAMRKAKEAKEEAKRKAKEATRKALERSKQQAALRNKILMGGGLSLLIIIILIFLTLQ